MSSRQPTTSSTLDQMVVTRAAGWWRPVHRSRSRRTQRPTPDGTSRSRSPRGVPTRTRSEPPEDDVTRRFGSMRALSLAFVAVAAAWEPAARGQEPAATFERTVADLAHADP